MAIPFIPLALGAAAIWGAKRYLDADIKDRKAHDAGIDEADFTWEDYADAAKRNLGAVCEWLGETLESAGKTLKG